MKKENYTNICWYCGSIFLSRKSTAKYCCPKHNSLYSRYGSQLCLTESNKGEFINHDVALNVMYHFLELDEANRNAFWSIPYTAEMISKFGYLGELPKYDEFVVADSYILKRITSESFLQLSFYVSKPFKKLTKAERRNRVFVRTEIIIENI